MWQKMDMAQYGDLLEKSGFKAALDLAHGIWDIAIVEANEPKLPLVIIQATKERKEPCWRRISQVIAKAFETGDASFIRLMADAIERYKKPIDRLREAIALQLTAREGFGDPMPTLTELQAILRARGFPQDQIGRRQIARILREDMEHTLPLGQRGRPRKKM